MNGLLFFVLWRGGLIALLGFGITQLYGWHPAPLLIIVLVGLAADSIAALWSFNNRRG